MDTKIKVIDRIENGKRIYGVVYKDGHVVWFNSLPEARAAFSKATRSKATRKKRNKGK